MKKIQAALWSCLTVYDTFKSNEKIHDYKIIRKLGHCSLVSLQSLDDKGLPFRVTSEIYAL